MACATRFSDLFHSFGFDRYRLLQYENEKRGQRLPRVLQTTKIAVDNLWREACRENTISARQA
jgi:hypothetical protein